MFTSIREDNSGTYKCKAITSEGELETTAVLNVAGGGGEEDNAVTEEKRKRKHLKPVIVEETNVGEETDRDQQLTSVVVKSEGPRAPSFGPRYSLAHVPADSDELRSLPQRVRKMKQQRRRALLKHGRKDHHHNKGKSVNVEKEKKEEEFAKPPPTLKPETVVPKVMPPKLSAVLNTEEKTHDNEGGQQNRRAHRYKNVQYSKVFGCKKRPYFFIVSAVRLVLLPLRYQA